jgi:hypothetical protein
MDQASAFVQQNSSLLGTAVFIILALVILYVIYSYLYPASDPTYVQLLQNEADARSVVPISNRPPTIYTGGDFTISMWIYVDDWNYRVSKPKFLFSVNSQNGAMPIVAILSPYKNNMTVGVNTVHSGTAPSLTDLPTLMALMNNQLSMSMFDSGVGSNSGAEPYPVHPNGFNPNLPPGPGPSPPEPGENSLEVKDIPLQRWTCLTFVSSGKVFDVYVDGKLSRSTVFANLLKVPRGPLSFRLGEFGGFGGRYSSVQMWNQQLTPDVIYGIYMMGPTQSQHNILTDISKYLNLNVSFTGSAPGQPIHTTAPANPFDQMGNAASQGYSSVSSDISQGYSSITQRL